MTSQSQQPIDHIEAPPPVAVAEDPSNYTLDRLLKLFRLSRTTQIHSQYRDELKELTKRQAEVRFLTNLRRVILQSKGKNNGFDANSADFKDLLAKAKEPGNEEFLQLLNEVGIVEGQDYYSEDDKNNLLESVRLVVEQLNTLSDMQVQMVTRLEAEINETYQMLMAIYKPLHNAITSMARAIKG
jgi:hypothetical protein